MGVKMQAGKAISSFVVVLALATALATAQSFVVPYNFQATICPWQILVIEELKLNLVGCRWVARSSIVAPVVPVRNR